MIKLHRALFILVFITAILNASTFYTLNGIKKVYPVVEISGSKVPKKYKEFIYKELKTMTNDLKINTTGYDPRFLAIVVTQIDVKKTALIDVRLSMGEQVLRLQTKEKTFATTYQNSEHFLLHEGDDFEDKFEDTLSDLLNKFSEQYKEENDLFTKVSIDENDFASEMRYETNYDEAIAKGKKMHKNIMLVLVANYCPWCRKFEQRVLLKKEVNEIIQKNYIPLILNKEKDKFPKEFNKAFTPIIHFINYKTLKSYESVVGYNNKDEFLHLLKTDTMK